MVSLRGKKCRCSVCKEVFSTLSNFDKHRKGDYEHRYCVNPETAGLIKHEIKGGHVWKGPGNPELKEKFY